MLSKEQLVEILKTKKINTNFHGISIPAIVMMDTELSATEKILMGEIHYLSNTGKEEGVYCFATNGYLGKIVGMHKNSVSRSIKKLQKKGFITIALFEEGYRCIETLIIETKKTPKQSGLYPYQHGG